MSFGENSAPATGGGSVTPNDSTNIEACRALWIASSGNLTVTTTGGDKITLTAIPDSTLLPVACIRVWSTGTTCGGIVALR